MTDFAEVKISQFSPVPGKPVSVRINPKNFLHPRRSSLIVSPRHGGVAQLGERLTGSQEDRGSIPLVSLVADDDALARVAVQHGYTVLGARLDLCNEDLLGVDDAAAVFDVLDALGILAEGRVPTLEDIMKSYLESCVDVPAGGWGTFAER